MSRQAEMPTEAKANPASQHHIPEHNLQPVRQSDGHQMKLILLLRLIAD